MVQWNTFHSVQMFRKQPSLMVSSFNPKQNPANQPSEIVIITNVRTRQFHGATYTHFICLIAGWRCRAGGGVVLLLLMMMLGGYLLCGCCCRCCCCCLLLYLLLLLKSKHLRWIQIRHLILGRDYINVVWDPINWIICLNTQLVSHDEIINRSDNYSVFMG